MLKLNKLLAIFLVLFSVFTNLSGLQFGDGTRKHSFIFKEVEKNVKSVYAKNHTATYIIKDDDSLWGTGELNTTDFTKKYVETTDIFIKLDEGCKYFDGKYKITLDGRLFYRDSLVDCDVIKFCEGLYIKKDSSLWAVGSDNHGRFGLGKKKSVLDKPVMIMDCVKDVYATQLYSQVITANGDLFISGEHYLPDHRESSCKFFMLAKNVKYSDNGFYITDKNELYAFGFAAEGALGIGVVKDGNWRISPTKIMDNVKTVSSSQQATLILLMDGSLYGCGGDTPNYFGELGLGNRKAVFTPKYITSDVTDICMGDCHSAIIKTDSSLWCCGANDYIPLQ